MDSAARLSPRWFSALVLVVALVAAPRASAAIDYYDTMGDAYTACHTAYDGWAATHSPAGIAPYPTCVTFPAETFGGVAYVGGYIWRSNNGAYNIFYARNEDPPPECEGGKVGTLPLFFPADGVICLNESGDTWCETIVTRSDDGLTTHTESTVGECDPTDFVCPEGFVAYHGLDPTTECISTDGDADGDGIANGDDTDPANYGDGTDTDGDGVPDAQDTAPNDPTNGSDDTDGPGGDDPPGDESNNESSGGGSCSSPPTCSGDGIACSINFQTWATRCGVERINATLKNGLSVTVGEGGDSSSSATGGNCTTPYTCTGSNGIECAILQEQRKARCAAESIVANTGTIASNTGATATNTAATSDGVGDLVAASGSGFGTGTPDGDDDAELGEEGTAAGNGHGEETEIGEDGLNEDGLGLPRTCPADPVFHFAGQDITVDMTYVCLGPTIESAIFLLVVGIGCLFFVVRD